MRERKRNSVFFFKQAWGEGSALRAYCTVAFVGVYPGSPVVSVVTGSAVAEVCTPAKRSYPEKDTPPVSDGAEPFCEVDGVRETWKLPCAEAPCARSPAFQVTVRDPAS